MKTKIFTIIAMVVMLSVVLSACAPAATPTEAPAAPAATEAPAEPVATEAPAEPVETEAPAEPAATEAPAEPEEYVFGLLMVGPYNDHGWSQATYEGAVYVEEKLPGTKLVYIDKVNTADRPGTTPASLAEELVAQGAKLVIFNSDDMKDSATEFSQTHPDIKVIMVSGDQVWKDGKAYVELPNMVNIMGRMEYGKMIAGCAAALTTQTGKIGYLGP